MNTRTKSVIVMVLCLGYWATYDVLAIPNFVPSTTDQLTACSCGGGKSTDPCNYSVSTQNTFCDCGATCCNSSGNSVQVTITPWNNGCCSPTGCEDAFAGTASGGKGTVESSDCGG